MRLILMTCKLLGVMALLVAGGALSGCANQNIAHEDDSRRMRENIATDIQIVDTIRDSGVRAAIVSQHTLYPYHFVNRSASLNDLGERDLAVLASHLRANGGEINLPRMSADGGLYNARVQQVMQALRAQGVSADKVRIADSMGGPSALSEDSLRDVQTMRSQQAEQPVQRSVTVTEQGSSQMGGK